MRCDYVRKAGRHKFVRSYLEPARYRVVARMGMRRQAYKIQANGISFLQILRIVSALLLYLVVRAPDLRPPPHVSNVLFFDGVCNLCDGFVNFVASWDKAERVRFGAIQRHKEYLQGVGAGAFAEGGSKALTTVVLLQGEDIYIKSAAALRVIALIGQPWTTVAGLLYMLPRGLRDYGYETVARHRYAVFGASETCREPGPKFQARFLEHVPEEEAMPWGK